jgi:hypothetical protein
MNKILFFTLLIFTLFIIFKEDSIDLGPGVLAPNEPYQEKISNAASFPFKNFTITPLANFEIQAKVLSRENYSAGREAELSPTDLALGWGRMSDKTVTDTLEIWQSGRWYRWRTQTLPIPKKEIELHSANMHMLPKDENVRSALKKVRRGDIVNIKGYLVRVDSSDGWHWVSSLSRGDSGNGACEIVFLEEIKVKNYTP